MIAGTVGDCDAVERLMSAFLPVSLMSTIR
jgi:hypothetical protein